MDIVVVLATSRREDLLRRTLTSLAACHAPAGYQGAVVVENGHKGGAEQIVAEVPPLVRTTYLYQERGNKSLALNAALHEIRDALVVFLDDDVRLSPDLLRLYAAAAASFGPGHFFGGPFEVDYEQPPPEWVKPYLPGSATGWHAGTGHERAPFVLEARTPRFIGFNWAAFAADIHRLGGFDERFGPGSTTGSVGQESQMQGRLLAAGARPIYVPGAMAWHWVPVNRCSPEFALERAHREGIRRGLSKDRSGSRGIAGYPAWLVARSAQAWIRARVARVTRSSAARFAAEFEWQTRRGQLKGVALRANGRQTTPGA